MLQKPDGFEDLDKDPLTDKRKYKEECRDFNELHMFFSWMISFSWTGVGEEKVPTLGVLSLFVFPDHFIRQSYYLLMSSYVLYTWNTSYTWNFIIGIQHMLQDWLINQETFGETFILLG